VGNHIATNGLHSIISGGFSNYLADANYNNHGQGGSVIAGGDQNTINNSGEFIGESTIGGGGNNTILDAEYGGSVIAGGQVNTIANYGTYGDSTIGGGSLNTILDGDFGGSVIAGGVNNIIRFGTDTVISGGVDNSASGIGSFIGGGGTDGLNYFGNTNNGAGAVIGGGVGNYIATNGTDAVIVGGSFNVVAGTNSFAAGNNARATNNGAFVWSDASSATTTSFTNNQFMARASGGVIFLTGSAASPTSYATGSAGAALLPGATSWTTVSDRNAKKNFQPVNTEDVLAKLAAIPMQQWNYKWEKDTDVPNIGPMAQDFKHAFYPGRDDKGISTLEFDGVELAAIQGLNEKVEGRSQKAEGQIEELKAENADLKARLEKLEQLINQKNGGDK
jgi:hypothetical protein